MGGQFEVKDGATKKYYSIAGMMVAVNDGSAVQYLLTDHLGSTVAVTDSSGTLTSQQRYLPFGGERAIPNSPILATDFGYTGQRLLDSGMGGIMDYKARFYSPMLGRFLQPDTIIPNPANPQSMNRYAYVSGNPLRYSDPSGHMEYEEAYTENDGKCGVGDTSCNWVGKKKVKPPLTSAPSIPMCNAPVQCTLGSANPDHDIDIDVASANSYYWETAAYAETAYYATNNLSLAKNGINYGLSGHNIFGLNGRYYTPGSINSAIVKGFSGLNALGFSFATSLIGNYVDFTWGANAGKGYGQEFAVSTAVDTALGFVVGAGAALLVGAAIGATAAPLAVIVVTAVLATTTTMMINKAGIPSDFKAGINNLISGP